MVVMMKSLPVVSKIHPAHHRRVAHTGKEKHVFREGPSKWKGPDLDENTKNKNFSWLSFIFERIQTLIKTRTAKIGSLRVIFERVQTLKN